MLFHLISAVLYCLRLQARKWVLLLLHEEGVWRENDSLADTTLPPPLCMDIYPVRLYGIPLKGTVSKST